MKPTTALRTYLAGALAGSSALLLPAIALAQGPPGGINPDKDNDGVPMSSDLCTNAAEDLDGWDDADGCPDPDNDGDGFLDVEDDCPNVVGIPPMSGCPQPSEPVFIGRPLRTVHGYSTARSTKDRSVVATQVGLSASSRQVIGELWLRDALLEHASVASFGRASLEMMALGAPPALVAGYHRAALDEVRHAEACFELAAIYSGERHSPREMEVPGPRGLSLTELAVHTFDEACVEETIATLCASAQLSRCTVDQARHALTMIVEDEARHAALAWQTVRWAVEKGGAQVLTAVRSHAVFRRAATPPTTHAGEEAQESTLRAHGRLTRVAELQLVERAWAEVIEPLLDDLADSVSK